MSVEFNVVCYTYGGRIPVKLFYKKEDPAVVNVTFYNMDESSPEWTLSRSTLQEALNVGQAGMCDVKVNVFADRMEMILSSPEGYALATFDVGEIKEFLEATYDEVPEGSDEYEIPDEIPEDWLV